MKWSKCKLSKVANLLNGYAFKPSEEPVGPVAPVGPVIP